METDKILIITAVDAESGALKQGIGDNPRFLVKAGGVGQAQAAASTMMELQRDTYRMVINAGIAGGFKEKAGAGSIVVANEIWAADAGAESADGFQSLEKLKLGESRYECDTRLTKMLCEGLYEAGLTVKIGPVLTTSTVTGTTETAEKLEERIPGAAAEAMEGYGAAAACQLMNVPVLELRTISNIVGPRDRANWKIKEALAALEKAGSVIQEVF
ncbi:futalosine hydrolase [Alteribacillus sp. HJP-4]|uniref:futalosine hydrolase n=1 Tax=Alteribacillus sp. HJP-4 TaxID=2775394 RepID=UPI0035CD1464